MLNKNHKKLAVYLIGAAMFAAIALATGSAGTVIQYVFAQNPAKKTACPFVNYYKEFDVFISHLVSYDDFTEYFKDFFRVYSNPCHADDIFSLQGQLHKQTAAVRKAYENCDMTSLPKLKRKAYELQAELMYVRKSIINNPNKTAGQPTMIKNKGAKKDLYMTLVLEKKIFADDDFQNLYAEFEKKYESRFDDYNNCVEPTWKELTEKWNEFVNTSAGLSPAWNKLEKSVEKKAKKINESPPGGISRGFSLEKWTEIRINSVKPEQALGDIYEEGGKHIPGGGGPTHEDLLSAVQSEAGRYASEAEEQDLFARYEVLYKDDFAESINIFRGKIEKLNDEAGAILNEILRETFPIQKKLFECVNTIQEKQCANHQIP